MLFYHLKPIKMTEELQNLEYNFVVKKDEKGESIFTFVRFLCPELSNAMLEITDNEEFFNTDVEMTESQLFQYVEQINMKVEAGNMALFQLAIYLGDCFRVKNEQYAKMSETGKISFDHLSKIFHVGSEFVAFSPEGELVGSIVVDARVEQTPFTKFFKVSGKFTFSDGKSFYQQPREFYIPYYGGMQHVETLSVRPMKPDDKKILTERGKIFSKYALKPNYVVYTGTMFVQTAYGPMHFNSNGRIMIDHVGSRKNRPDDGSNFYGGYGGQQQKNKFETIPDDLLYLTWPFFDAFSFKAKRWGKAYVRNVTEIKFDDSAFDTLVLDSQKKMLVKALVLHSDKGFSDIISDKSGGCIFCLHGPPGTGKTLTAESISELLHQPLYSITVGELGTTTDMLEHKLTSILEMTESWKAVLLIDECDMFLEKRSDGDIQKNAIVGIFLRLLERHTGVMFLTTNRITSLDPAFESRISVNIGYKELDEDSRFKIWNNLLTAANVNALNDDDVKCLAKLRINGRQIKNSIRMSQALSCDLKEELTINHFNTVNEHISF
jgi:hypothetical protein